MSLAERPADPDPELLDWLRLTLVPGIGPKLMQSLLAHFETPASVLTASISELQRVDGIGPKLAMSIVAHSDDQPARQELIDAHAARVQLLLCRRAGYPTPLEQLPDPPPILWSRGTWQPSDQLAVAIVGSRHCTAYGRRVAENLSYGLAQAGVTIISGLAKGIDAAAHQGALKANGRTIAVLANGLDWKLLYPPQHRELAEQIVERGALVTEYSLKQAPLQGMFPQRNRLISGLSLGVILVEASRNSGALHTARHAMEQNREVFAVPGPIDSEASAGCLDLLRDGATLVRGVEDILSALGPLTAPVQRHANDSPQQTGRAETVHAPRELLLSDQEREILNLVPRDPVPIDAVLQQATIEASRVLATLTVLEMKHHVRRHPGGQVSRY